MYNETGDFISQPIMRNIKITSLIYIILLCSSLAEASELIENNIKKSTFVDGLTEGTINKMINEGIWNHNKKALAVSTQTKDGCICIVAINNNNKIKIINVNQLERSILVN